MADFRRNPFDEIENMQKQMDRFLDHFAGPKRPVCFYSPSAWQPPMDIYETADDLVVVIAASGLDRDSLEISIDRNMLTIKGERHDLLRGVREKYHLAEIAFGPFERVVELPTAVDSAQSSASYKDGMLAIVLPKAAERVATTVRIRTT